MVQVLEFDLLLILHFQPNGSREMALSELPLISLELWGEICTHTMHQSHSVSSSRAGLRDAESLQTPLCSCGELGASASLTPWQNCLFLAIFSC